MMILPSNASSGLTLVSAENSFRKGCVTSGRASIENVKVMILLVFSERLGNSTSQYFWQSSKSARIPASAFRVASFASFKIAAQALFASHLASLNCALSYGAVRSEEHTSELQSLRHLLCRLLLEKK